MASAKSNGWCGRKHEETRQTKKQQQTEDDLKELVITRWRAKTQRNKEWIKIVEQAMSKACTVFFFLYIKKAHSTVVFNT